MPKYILNAPEQTARPTIEREQVKWGRLTVLDDNYEEKVLLPEPKKPGEEQRYYDSGEVKPARFVLRCDCGFEFMLWRHEFTAAEVKRHFPDCTREQCKYTQARLELAERKEKDKALREKIKAERLAEKLKKREQRLGPKPPKPAKPEKPAAVLTMWASGQMKKSVGRPPEQADERMFSRAISMPMGLIAQIEEMAYADKVTFSAMVRKLLRQAVVEASGDRGGEVKCE